MLKVVIDINVLVSALTFNEPVQAGYSFFLSKYPAIIRRGS